MKRAYFSLVFCIFLTSASVSAFDLTGTWEGTMYCSHYAFADPPEDGEYFMVEIEQRGYFIRALNIKPNPGQICQGVIDGTNISITCDDGTFSYGMIKGKKIFVINHIPEEPSTCKATVQRVP